MNRGSSTPYLKTTLPEPDLFNLPSEIGKEPFDLSRLLTASGVNLPWATTVYLKHDRHLNADDKTRDRYYKRLYRHIQELADKGYLEVKKGNDSLIWIAPNNRTFNLIKGKHYSNSLAKGPDKENNDTNDNSLPEPVKPPQGPRAHIRPERSLALLIPRGTRTLEEEDLEKIHEHYVDYRTEIDNTVLLFKHREDLTNIDGEIRTKPYETRFNSLPRKVGAEKKYRGLWNRAGVMFNRGVFLTLTTDTSRHRSVEEANKAFGPALNRFMSWVRKRVRGLGYGRLSFITANEFQKNGLLHAHIVIFGLPYLEHYKRISYLWSQTGQGKIIYIYSLKRDAKGWYWTRGKPKDAEKGQSCSDYLKKYLSKNLQDDGQDLYWVFGKRFFTNSKTLEPDPTRPALVPGDWVYIGSCHRSEVPQEVEEYNKRMTRTGTGPPGPPLSALA